MDASHAGGVGAGVIYPAPFFVDGNYRLRWNIWSSVAGVTLALRWRARRLDDQQLVDATEQLAPTANRVVTTADLVLPIGALTNVDVFALAGAPAPCTVFTTVQLIRGAGAAATVIATLLQSYVAANVARAWPGSLLENPLDGPGALVSVVGATPGAGVDISETMPAGCRRELLSLRARFVTSATVANRFATLTLDDGTANAYFEGGVLATAQAATQTARWTWAQGLNAQINQNGFNGALLNRAYLGAGYRIKTLTLAIQVGDQWDQVQYVLREWLTAD